MSLSDEWTEWHLTPRGWEEGSTQIDFGNRTNRPRPNDAVLSVKYREIVASMYSKCERTRHETWRSRDPTTVDALLAKYGECPESL